MDVFPKKCNSLRHFQPPASCSGTRFCFPDWLNLSSPACMTLLSFLCCSLALSSTLIPASYYGSGHDRLSCTGRLTASASRSPGGLLWQELTSHPFISEWAENNVLYCFFFVFFFYDYQHFMLQKMSSIWIIKKRKNVIFPILDKKNNSFT